MSTELSLRACTCKLAPRWGVVFAMISAVIVVILALKNQSIPMMGELVMSPGQDGAVNTVRLPIALPRLIDPVVVMVPATLLAGVLYEVDDLTSRWVDDDQLAVLGGVFIGVVGGLLVAYPGFSTAIGGSVLAGVLVLAGSYTERATLLQAYTALPIAATTLWLVCSLFTGSVPALIFAVVGLGVASGTYFGLWLILSSAHRLITGPVRRALTCDC